MQLHSSLSLPFILTKETAMTKRVDEATASTKEASAKTKSKKKPTQSRGGKHPTRKAPTRRKKPTKKPTKTGGSGKSGKGHRPPKPKGGDTTKGGNPVDTSTPIDTGTPPVTPGTPVDTMPPVTSTPPAQPGTPVDTKPTDSGNGADDTGENTILCGAIHNDTTALLMFYPKRKIAKGVGAALYRREVLADGTLGPRVALVSRLPFKGQETDWEARSTAEWPIQKFYWFDFEADWDKQYVYEGDFMEGTAGNLTAMPGYSFRTNAVKLTTECGQYFNAAFTRGILASQKMAKFVKKNADGSWDEADLITQLKDPKSLIRRELGGRVMDMLLSFVHRAEKEGGHVFEARYEAADPQWVGEYERLAHLVSMILGEAGKDDETNKDARARFHAAGMDIVDRFVPEGSIPHNKLSIFQDLAGDFLSILGMSTNATYTALTTQTNNVTEIKWPPFAKRVKLEYWDPLHADTLAGSLQSAHFRALNASGPIEELLPDGKTKIIAWRSPNMTTRDKPKTQAPMPPDMKFATDLVLGVKKSLFFLLFWPGWPSIMNAIETLNQQNHGLLLRGAVSNPAAMPGPSFKLFHRVGEAPQIVAASALENPFGAFKLKELLKLSTAHAIIHDKVLTGDVDNPEICFVVFGSHQLGFKASYANDEVMFIIIGPLAHPLVQAYTVHILATYQTYKFRSVQNTGKSEFTGFLAPDDSWQDRQFNLDGLKFEGDVWRNSGLLVPSSIK
jgi:hypothetical protein